MKKKSNSKQASIIIVGYNGLAYLEKCLNALQKEVEAHQSEVILIDNASTDGGPDFVEQHYPDVRLIRNKNNIGFAAGCNQGARYAQGEALVFLNQDTEVLPGWLSQLLRPLFEDKRVALVTSKLLLMSQPDKINACGQNVHFTGLAFTRGFLDHSNQYPEASNVSAVHGASFSIRQQIWQELGGFDEDFFMYYEETDLSWRAQLAGYNCLYVPTSISYHDYRLGKPSRLGLYYLKRNRIIMLLKNWRWQTILLLSPSLLLAELIDWGHALLIGQAGWQAKLAAYRSIVTNFAKIMHARQEAQSKRKVGDLITLTQCTYKLSSKEVTGGFIGRLITTISEKLFFLNYWLTQRICQTLNL